MTIEHSAISDTQAHEPKNISTASAGEVYVADGANSGGWKVPPIAIAVKIDDISTADTIYLASPVTGVISRISVCINGAIATADATVSATINGTSVTGGAVVMPFSGSAAGDVVTVTPTANNTISALTDYISLATDGASTNTVEAWVSVYIQPS